MASDDIGPVLCGKCHVSPERGFERDGQMWASCSICGQEAPVEEIMREAVEYHTDKAVRSMFSGLRSSGMTVESPPEREYRWITSA